MSLQFSAVLRQSQALAIINSLGPNPTLVLYQGTMPNNCETPTTDPIIATFNLPNPYFITQAGVNSLTGNWSAICTLAGTPNYFQLQNNGECILQGVVGCSFTAAWFNNTPYTVGTLVVNGDNVYNCIVSGTSSPTGPGPTGTGNGIVDNSCAWNYAGIFGDLNFAPPTFILGQMIVINAFNIIEGNQ
jgi:hypothetical protein